MKKIILCTMAVLLVLVLAMTVIGPHVILGVVRQEESAPEYAYRDSFHNRYDEIRVHLQELTAGLGTEIHSYAVDEASLAVMFPCVYDADGIRLYQVK